MPDGYMVVFAVDDSESLEEAESILNYLKSEEILSKHAVILVANKTDLVRSRVISTNGESYLHTEIKCIGVSINDWNFDLLCTWVSIASNFESGEA